MVAGVAGVARGCGAAAAAARRVGRWPHVCESGAGRRRRRRRAARCGGGVVCEREARVVGETWGHSAARPGKASTDSQQVGGACGAAGGGGAGRWRCC